MRVALYKGHNGHKGGYRGNSSFLIDGRRCIQEWIVSENEAWWGRRFNVFHERRKRRLKNGSRKKRAHCLRGNGGVEGGSEGKSLPRVTTCRKWPFKDKKGVWRGVPRESRSEG